MIEATVDTFEELAASGPVLVDIWGPQCQPCLALMPAVESLAVAWDVHMLCNVGGRERTEISSSPRSSRSRSAGEGVSYGRSPVSIWNMVTPSE